MSEKIQEVGAAATDDARPVLQYAHSDSSHTAAQKAFEFMSAVGCFYVREQRGLQPALVRRVKPDIYLPVRVAWLQLWITQHFRCWDKSRGDYAKAPRQLASWIITVVRAGLSGLPGISNSTLDSEGPTCAAVRV